MRPRAVYAVRALVASPAAPPTYQRSIATMQTAAGIKAALIEALENGADEAVIVDLTAQMNAARRAETGARIGAAQADTMSRTQPIVPRTAPVSADDQDAVDREKAINAVKNLPGVQDLEQNGSWLFLKGNTRPIADALRDAGFRLSSKRTQEASALAGTDVGVWYWKPASAGNKKPRRAYGEGYTRAKYGARDRLDN